ncbi:MAG: hypothetical protein AAF460_07510, partial [Pseudomonadota bacterium]
MQKNLLITLAASAVLAGCSSLGGGSGEASPMHNIDCPGGEGARDGYVGNPASNIYLNAGSEFLHGPG